MNWSPSTARVRVVLSDLEAACDRVDAAADPDAVFLAAADLAERARGLPGVIAELRAQAAACIWETDRLSLAALADRIGVSKARADQLLRSVRREEAP